MENSSETSVCTLAFPPEIKEVTEVTVTEATVPEVTVPEATVSEVTVPEATVSEVTVPETTVSEVTVPEATVSEVTDSEVTDSEVTDSEVTDSEVFDSEVTDSEVFDSDVTDSEVTDSEVSDSEVSDSEVTDSEATEVTVPEVAKVTVSDGTYRIICSVLSLLCWYILFRLKKVPEFPIPEVCISVLMHVTEIVCVSLSAYTFVTCYDETNKTIGKFLVEVPLALGGS